jgi:hypothetical protein
LHKRHTADLQFRSAGIHLSRRDNSGRKAYFAKTAAANPLISEIVIRNEAEILDARPEFAALGRVTRVAEILQAAGLKRCGVG